MTTPVTTLAQISDVHLPFSNRMTFGEWNIKRVLGLLNWHRGRRFVHRFEALEPIMADLAKQKPNHIAVTGDLVNLGLPHQYDAAKTFLQAIGQSDQVSVIPGNHDIYCPVDPSNQCTSIWSDYMRSDDFAEDRGLVEAAQFPFVRRIGPLALIGLNSAIPTPPFIAQGHVDERQQTALRSALRQVADEGLFACVIIHHPPLQGLAPERRALVNTDELTKLLTTEPVGVVVYGHNHRDKVTWIDNTHSPGGKVAVCGAASGSAYRRHKDEPLARYYLYELAGSVGAADDLRVTRITRGLSLEKNRVVELDRQQVFPVP